MSKKKPGKKPAKKPVAKKVVAKKAVKKKSVKRSPAARRATATLAAVPGKRNNTATIFLYKVDGNYRVRTSPQLISAAPIRIRNGNERKSFADAKPGRYKYNITANGYTEDPEIEYPMN